MNILVTGGAGFAGSYISNYLAECGHFVTATYRNSYPTNMSKKVRCVKQELSQSIDIDGQFDAIVHTACSRSSEGIDTTMDRYVRDNIDSARQLVDFARRTGIKTIIYFSTRSIYGEIRTPEADESSDVINSGKYGLTKYVAEYIFKEAKDINTIGFRTPGIIGPGAHDIWLVDIVNKIKNGQEVQISNFETQNFVHILDICHFISKLIDLGSSGNSFKHNVVNLACKETINNIDIAKIIKHRLNSESKIYVKEPGDGLFRMRADKAFEMGFEPMTPREIVNLYLDGIIENNEE